MHPKYNSNLEIISLLNSYSFILLGLNMSAVFFTICFFLNRLKFNIINLILNIVLFKIIYLLINIIFIHLSLLDFFYYLIVFIYFLIIISFYLSKKKLNFIYALIFTIFFWIYITTMFKLSLYFLGFNTNFYTIDSALPRDLDVYLFLLVSFANLDALLY